MKIADSSQMRELDRITIEETGIPATILMENAGREISRVLMDLLPDLKGSQILILCGPGNNGGDGFVVSRYLSNYGCDPDIILLGKRDMLRGPARLHADVSSNLGIHIHELMSPDDIADVNTFVSQANIIIDAMFGTGLHRPVQGHFADLIQTVNDADAFIVSIDTPSGMSADSNHLIGPTIRADLTVTLGLPKPSLLLYPAAHYAGQVIVADISIPPQNCLKTDISGSILTPDCFPAFFSPRAPDCHKGCFGHLLTIAGSPGKTGAAILAARAAARAGAGLITVAIPGPLNTILEMALTEVMTLPLPGPYEFFSPYHLPSVIDALKSKTAVVVGPGLGTRPETADFFRAFIESCDIPIILDADALNLVAGMDDCWTKMSHTRILTPHPGEFSRLARISTTDLSHRSLQAVREFAVSSSSIVVYKTARTIIAFPDGQYLINITGSPGLASGGSGDVLSGIIGGLLARNLIPEQAVAAGVFWHGLTGDMTAADIGEEEMLAGDMIDFMGRARQFVFDNHHLFRGNSIPYTEGQTAFNF